MPTIAFLGERADLAAAHKLCGNAVIVGLSAVLADPFAGADDLGVPARDAAAERPGV